MTIKIRQVDAPPASPKPHRFKNQIVSVSLVNTYLHQQPLTTVIRRFLFEMTKDGQIYWIGVSIADGIKGFDNVQIYFHPPPTNQGKVWARDEDYSAFTGGWIGKYDWVGINGGQLAGVRPATPLIVPFMRDAAYRGSSPEYMFATKPMETLSAIIAAVRTVVTGKTADGHVGRIGVSSFSRGIEGMRLFIRTFGSSRLVVEATDFDSPFIIGSLKTLTTPPKGVGRVVSQIPPPHGRTPGWLYLPEVQFKFVNFAPDTHQKIGRMTFFAAMAQSTII